MAKRTAQSAEPSPERQWAEEMSVIGERLGMPRMSARLLGWMLICEPPRQSLSDLQRALGVSRASVSIATRLLQASGLVRRVAVPGSRGYSFELDPGFFSGQLDAANPFSILRDALDRGVQVAGGEDDPRARRLRDARDFYAFVAQSVPETIARYRELRASRERGRTT